MTFAGYFFLAAILVLLGINGIWPRFKFVSTMLVFVGFVGLILIFGDRVTRIDIGPFHFEQVTAKAVSDAIAIGDLRTRVENQSATVDLVAKKASAAEQLSKDAEEQINEARKSLADVNSAISEAKASLEKVQAIASLTELVTDAQNDDRNAFDKLRKIANDPNNPLAQRADSAWRSIANSLVSTLRLEFKVPWSPGIDPSRFGLWDLEIAYNSAAEQTTRIAILQYILKRTDIIKVEKLDLLLKVAGHDRSLKNVVYALRSFDEETSASVPATLDIDYAENWWKAHRQEFVNK